MRTLLSGVNYKGLRRERVLASPQFHNGAFRNGSGVGPGLQSDARSVMSQWLFGREERTPKANLPLDRPHEAWARPADTGLRATWLGHSTVLLEMDGYRVLTDPVFGLRASPFTFAGPRRFHSVPSRIEDLPSLDAVVISHDHYDHLCASTVQALAQMNVPIVTSLGVGARLEALGVRPENIHELDWHESVLLGGIQLTATPCQHFSGRGLRDRDHTLWSSWVIQSSNQKVFFSGDTGFSLLFEELGRRYGPFDLVLLEVGAFHESWSHVHLGPANALKVFRLLGGGTLLPVHWGTFELAMHAWDEPAETLVRLATEQSLRVLTPRLGQVFEPSQIESASPWWRGLRKGQPALYQLAESRS